MSGPTPAYVNAATVAEAIDALSDYQVSLGEIGVFEDHDDNLERFNVAQVLSVLADHPTEARAVDCVAGMMQVFLVEWLTDRLDPPPAHLADAVVTQIRRSVPYMEVRDGRTEPQPRDHSVPCGNCRRPTMNISAYCNRCE